MYSASHDESDDGLAAAAPRDRGVVVERDEARRRVAVERVLCPIGACVPGQIDVRPVSYTMPMVIDI
jgi:hypothetical protein